MNSIELPMFDRLYVISDLHLGGEVGRQIFTEGVLLAQFIDYVRLDAPNEQVALVINGDMVDFLAEPNPRTFDPYGAVDKLRRIRNDPTFAGVWDALVRFTATSRRTLVVNLGNHDLELALPWVRAELLRLLAGPNEAALGRIIFVGDGSGFTAQVCESSVLCLHGNEVDTWNVTDYEMIRCIGRDVMQGRVPTEWTPNAGTKLVIEIMNDIKRNYAFVDLLKPEVQAVLPVLLALNEGLASRLERIGAVAARLSWDKVRRVMGLLSQGELSAPTALEMEEGGFPRRSGARMRDGSVPARRGAQLSESPVIVASAEDNFRAGTDPIALIDPSFGDHLGAFAAFQEWTKRKPPVEVLLAAVRDLDKDRSFELSAEDGVFKRIDKYVAETFDFVVTGHTHMEKRLSRSRGKGAYLNTGSWVPRIQFTPAMLSSVDAFGPVFETIKASATIAALEAPSAAHPPLVIRRPTTAMITGNGPQKSGLYEIVSSSNGVTLRELV